MYRDEQYVSSQAFDASNFKEAANRFHYSKIENYHFGAAPQLTTVFPHLPIIKLGKHRLELTLKFLKNHWHNLMPLLVNTNKGIFIARKRLVVVYSYYFTSFHQPKNGSTRKFKKIQAHKSDKKQPKTPQFKSVYAPFEKLETHGNSTKPEAKIEF